MSSKYPHDRARERQDSGEQPYKDARESMAEMQSDIQRDAEAFGEDNLRESDEERSERLRQEAEEQLRASQKGRTEGQE
ncbi:MAG: hypothetical protein AB7G88_09450 [Thermomicrobiales bacterium]